MTTDWNKAVSILEAKDLAEKLRSLKRCMRAEENQVVMLRSAALLENLAEEHEAEQLQAKDIPQIGRRR